MEHKSDYAIFTNKVTKKKLVYYPVKKNANTSAKFFILKHLGIEEKFFFNEDEMPRYKLTEEIIRKYGNKNNLIGFLPSGIPFKKVEADFKCCIVRDPIKRFISAFKNRVLYHKDKDFYNHSLDQIIEKLENNLFENKHFLPQSFNLGLDLSYYTHIGKTNNMIDFIDGINNFFQQVKEFPMLQTGGKEFKITLTNNQIKKIKKIYDNDYFMLKDISFD
tara:strand:+ start:88 stop:744 length:657 start_codon:yes stop_codon:yes gene_type:complete